MSSQPEFMDHIAGNTIIRYTELDPALLDVDAVVEEQDTSLLLGHSPVIRESVESFSSLLERMQEQRDEVPGNVIIKNSIPRRLIAIVYDIDHTPICLEDWVEQALTTILQHCKQYRLQSVAMPVLGTSYGELDQATFMDLLQKLLIQNRAKYPKHILIYQLN